MENTEIKNPCYDRLINCIPEHIKKKKKKKMGGVQDKTMSLSKRNTAINYSKPNTSTMCMEVKANQENLK